MRITVKRVDERSRRESRRIPPGRARKLVSCGIGAGVVWLPVQVQQVHDGFHSPEVFLQELFLLQYMRLTYSSMPPSVRLSSRRPCGAVAGFRRYGGRTNIIS